MNDMKLKLLMFIALVVAPMVAFSETDYKIYDGPEFSVEYPSDFDVEKTEDTESSTYSFSSSERLAVIGVGLDSSGLPSSLVIMFKGKSFDNGKLDNISRHFLETLEIKLPDEGYTTYDAPGFSAEIPSDFAESYNEENNQHNFVQNDLRIITIKTEYNDDSGYTLILGFIPISTGFGNDGKLNNITRHIIETLELKPTSTEIPFKTAEETSTRESSENEAPLGSRENPAPIGKYSLTTADDWKISVVSVVPDATRMVLDENMFNNPPKAGHQFFLAKVRACYTGEGSDTFSGSYRLRAVGASNVAYSTFENSCGVIPDELPSSEVFTGGCIEGYVGWEIRSSDANSLMMYDTPLFGSGSSQHTFLSLVP
ncbi:MAG TPA: hypothetical protein PLN41_06760 [Methanothrix sp.]|nr:hypothetical protein [Methanothrix sp.]